MGGGVIQKGDSDLLDTMAVRIFNVGQLQLVPLQPHGCVTNDAVLGKVLEHGWPVRVSEELKHRKQEL